MRTPIRGPQLTRLQSWGVVCVLALVAASLWSAIRILRFAPPNDAGFQVGDPGPAATQGRAVTWPETVGFGTGAERGYP